MHSSLPAATPSSAVELALIRRLRQPAHPFGARRFAPVQKPYKPSGFFLLACGNTVVRCGGLFVFVQKRFEVLGLRFEDARDDEYLLQCL